MSATYRAILTSFWSDPAVKKLIKAKKQEAVYLALYLITNEHGHVSGLYHLPLWMIAGETGIKDPEALLPLLADPSWSGPEEKFGFAHYDHETETVWVRSMLRIQGRGEKNMQAAAKRLRSVHGSFLIGMFLESYPGVSQYVGDIGVAPPPAAEAEPEVDEPPAPRESPKAARAREAWAVYLAEVRECKGILGLRAGDEPELTAARLKKIVDYIDSHGFERVCDAARGLRYSDWHMGRCADKRHKLSPEVVFHHTGKIHQVENLSDLFREAQASGRKAAAQPAEERRKVPDASIPVATYRARVIEEVGKRERAGILSADEVERYTERIDRCKDLPSLQEVARDLARKPA